MRLLNGDSLEIMPTLPDKMFDAILTDPPKPIGNLEFSLPVIDEFHRLTDGPIAWITERTKIHQTRPRWGKEQVDYANRNLEIKRQLPPPDAVWTWKPPVTYRFKGVDGATEYSYNPVQSDFHSIIVWQLEKPPWLTVSLFEMPVEKGWWVNEFSKPVFLMQALLALLTKQGDLVFDPFVGRGTTALACATEDRAFMGIDTDMEAIHVTERRLAEYYDRKEA